MSDLSIEPRARKSSNSSDDGADMPSSPTSSARSSSGYPSDELDRLSLSDYDLLPGRDALDTRSQASSFGDPDQPRDDELEPDIDDLNASAIGRSAWVLPANVGSTDRRRRADDVVSLVGPQSPVEPLEASTAEDPDSTPQASRHAFGSSATPIASAAFDRRLSESSSVDDLPLALPDPSPSPTLTRSNRMPSVGSDHSSGSGATSSSDGQEVEAEPVFMDLLRGRHVMATPSPGPSRPLTPVAVAADSPPTSLREQSAVPNVWFIGHEPPEGALNMLKSTLQSRLGTQSTFESRLYGATGSEVATGFPIDKSRSHVVVALIERGSDYSTVSTLVSSFCDCARKVKQESEIVVRIVYVFFGPSFADEPMISALLDAAHEARSAKDLVLAGLGDPDAGSRVDHDLVGPVAQCLGPAGWLVHNDGACELYRHAVDLQDFGKSIPRAAYDSITTSLEPERTPSPAVVPAVNRRPSELGLLVTLFVAIFAIVLSLFSPDAAPTSAPAVMNPSVNASVAHVVAAADSTARQLMMVSTPRVVALQTLSRVLRTPASRPSPSDVPTDVVSKEEQTGPEDPVERSELVAELADFYRDVIRPLGLALYLELASVADRALCDAGQYYRLVKRRAHEVHRKGFDDAKEVALRSEAVAVDGVKALAAMGRSLAEQASKAHRKGLSDAARVAGDPRGGWKAVVGQTKRRRRRRRGRSRGHEEHQGGKRRGHVDPSDFWQRFGAFV